tara:strand:+ start:581 stop:2665 length:2085 start_codon:yes stop_codon:yes gene_type:complete
MAQNLVINILAKDKTKQAFGVLKTRLGVLKQSIFSVQSALVGIGAGLVVRNLVNTGKELENLRTRLKFLLKDTNEGAKAFDNMVKFASKVPFSLEEIQSGSGILATVTDNADDLQKMLQITGNVAAVTGLDFRTASEQIQRSFSAGIGSADLFREKGVRNMLGFKAGATVSIEETVQAFEKVFGKGGRFGNATDELAQTFAGTLSMIGDKIFNFKKVLLEAGFFEELKKQFGDLDKFLSDNAERLDEIATTVGKNLAQAVTGAVSVGQDLIPTLQKIGSILKSIKDGFMSLPEFVREVGLVGAFLFGKKGAVALAGVSFIIDKINDFVRQTKVEAGIIDVDNIQEASDRLNIINQQLEDGFKKEQKILRNKFDQKIIVDEFITLKDHELQKLEDEKKKLETIIFLSKNKTVNQFELNRALGETVKTQKEIEKVTRKTFNIFESHHDLVEAVRKSEERTLKRIIDANRNVFEEQNDLIPKVKKEVTTREQILKNVKETNKQFNLGNEITDLMNTGVKGVSRGFAEALVLGKSLNKSMKELARSLLVEIIAKTIERIVLMGIEKVLSETLFKKEEDKENLLRKQNTAIKRQIALQMILNAIGGGGGGGLPFFAKGGAVSKNKPIVVGEQGPELFVPNQTGQITQSARGTGGGAVNVNFTINTIDSRGFDEALITNRATITGIINSALAEKGRSELV